MRKQQLEFLDQSFIKPKDAFGGSLLKGNPKQKRPIDSRMPTHLILRAARGGMRLPKVYAQVNEFTFATAKKYGVKIYKYANVGNHLHLVLRVKRGQWAKFIRELTGQIAQLMRALISLGKDESFWLYRPYTRIVRSWKKAYEIAKLYVQLNQWEAEGYISRKDVKTLKDLRSIWGTG